MSVRVLMMVLMGAAFVTTHVLMLVMLVPAAFLTVLVRVIVGVIVPAGAVIMVMVMVMVMIMVMSAALRASRLHGGQIEERQNHQADPGDEHHRAEDAVRRQVMHHATAHVKVEEHRAPKQEERHTDEMDRSLVHGLTASEVMKAAHGTASAPTRMKSPTRKPITTRRLNTEAYMKSSLMSIIGPKTRKASFAA